MKIVFANEYFVPFSPGGAEWSMYYWAKMLAENGHRLVIVTPDLGYPGESYSEDAALTVTGRVNIERFNFSRTMKMPPRVFSSYVFGNGRFHSRMAAMVRAAIIKTDADVVVSHGFDSIPAVKIASDRTGVPAIATFRDYRSICPVSICLHHDRFTPPECSYGEFLSCVSKYNSDYGHQLKPIKKMKMYLRRTLEWRNSQKIRSIISDLGGTVFVSKGIRDIYKRAVRLPACTKVIYNPPPVIDGKADGSVATDKFGLQGKKVLLFVGRFSIGKGAKVITEAMPLIRNLIPEAVTVVAGVPEYDNPTEGIVHTGFVNRDLLASLYSACHGVVLPSRWQEPFSRVILEASHFKKPIVATYAGGNTEAIKDGINGIIVTRNSADKFAEGCIRLLEMNQLDYKEMRVNTGNLLTEDFSPAKNLKNYETLLGQVIEGAKSGR